MNMIKLPLQRPKVPQGYKVFPWATCAPFVENVRGILIHRPRSVSTYNTYKQPHIGIGYWCGNHVSGDKNFTFLEAPPEGELLCARCEQAAVASGLPSADELSGRHVHLGKLKAVQLCCDKGEQNE